MISQSSSGDGSRTVFCLVWVLLTAAGGLAYAVPVSAVHWLATTIGILGPASQAGDWALPALAVTAALCGMAMGATVGAAQWLALRRRLSGAGWWVAGTAAGYGALGLLPLAAGAAAPGWSGWALTLVANGKPHWLARVEPSSTAASWPAGAVTLVVFGAVLGTAQWLVLHRRVKGAGWWVAAMAADWFLGALLSAEPAAAVLGSWLAPAVVGGGVMAWLLGRGRPATFARQGTGG